VGDRLTKSAERWASDRELLGGIEPALHLLVDQIGGWARIVGTIRVPMPDGREQAFEIAVEYPSADPFILPSTYDPVGRFPRDPDRHVECDGRFCLWLPQHAPSVEFAREGGLALYLCRVQEFLALQVMYEVRLHHGVRPYWPGEQWAHGQDGHRQWLEQHTANLSADQLQALLGNVAVPRKPGRRCPCGSGKRLGNCHKEWLRQLRHVWTDTSVSSAAYQLLKDRREALP